MNRTFKTGRFVNSTSALLLTILILFLSFVGASPGLHKLIHADADTGDHHCLVTMFVKGQISTVATAPIACSFIPHLTENLLLEKTVEHSLLDVRLAPSRAPPCS